MNAKPKRKPGRPHGTTKDAKVPVTVMLLGATKARLETSAKQAGVTRSVFVDKVLQAKFKKDQRS
jgi:hypothetical protein